MSKKNLSKIARSEALEHVGSSEQLDQRLVVIGSASWILLLVAALLISVAITWGFLGRLPNEVEGEGVILPRGTEPITISSPTGVGGVVEIIVAPNSDVKVGDPLVKLVNHALEVTFANATSKLAMLEYQNQRMTKAEQQIFDRQKASLDSQLASCKQTTDQTKKLSKLFESELEDIKQLVAEKLVPKSQLVQTQQQYFSVLQQLTQQETIVAKANEQYSSLVTSTQRQRLARTSALGQAREALRIAQTTLEVSTTVLSPVAGRVLDHAVDMGSTVSVGTTITSIRPHGDDSGAVNARVYVPYGVGRRIRPGMTAWLTLPFAKPSRHGYIAGEVLDVSDYVSGNSASIHLGSQELAEQMSKQLGPMLEVLVKIELDESTPTGLRWTSGRGYDQPVTFPSLCGVKIIVSEDRPIDIVLPWLKDLLGLDPQVKVLKDRPQ